MKSKTQWIGLAVAMLAFAFVHTPSANAQTPTATPSAAPANGTGPTPKPVERHVAPAGVYYLVEDAVAPLKGGIMGIPAGTEVRLVKDNGTTLQVTEGEHEFAVRRSQVTNDLDLAAVIQKRAAVLDSLNEKNLQEREAIAVKQQQDRIEFLRTHPLATPTPTPSPGRK